ncbi:hypothetical protein [Streptococcus suis]|uniref:hypothetical protein n=1 Tax=Streptococcus suis TaxID=1307 RepID=UPI0011462F51|nr:hypothetical protein [Streptococcus suis]NQI77379.1 hypothetical protein [Streptococcus suis]NQI79594.1 hypothetical protein [Streptococcus suis]NQI82686.1 hypothetical protein [Streptococcus suis]TQE79964.1 hypothetical protein FH693_08665 [Streptococcus suis]
MVKNTIEDVNNLLVAQLEKLSFDDLSPEELELEVTRSRVMVHLTDEILKTQALALRVVETLSDVTNKEVTPPKMLLGGGVNG